MPETSGTQRMLKLACAVVGLVLLIGGGLAYLEYRREWRQQQTQAAATALAERLGYTPASHLASGRWSADMGSRRGWAVYFTTTLTLDAFRRQVDHLGLTEQSFEPRTAGAAIFSDINLNTPQLLTANGRVGIGSTGRVPAPPAYRWWLLDAQERSVYLAIYSVADMPEQYAIDGQPIHGNIIGLKLHDDPYRGTYRANP